MCLGPHNMSTEQRNGIHSILMKEEISSQKARVRDDKDLSCDYYSPL